MLNPGPPLQPVAPVISAPAGLTVRDGNGAVHPVIALRVEGSAVTLLYLDEDTTVKPVPPQAAVWMSEVWLPHSEVRHQFPEN